jgi:hypothetical protein
MIASATLHDKLELPLIRRGVKVAIVPSSHTGCGTVLEKQASPIAAWAWAEVSGTIRDEECHAPKLRAVTQVTVCDPGHTFVKRRVLKLRSSVPCSVAGFRSNSEGRDRPVRTSLTRSALPRPWRPARQRPERLTCRSASRRYPHARAPPGCASRLPDACSHGSPGRRG